MANKKGMATGVEVARISVKVSPDTRQFRRELKNQLEDIENKAKLDIDSDTDTSGVKKKVTKLKNEVSAKPIKLTTNTKSIEASIDSLQKGLNKLDLKWDKKVMAFRLENFKPEADFAQARAETNRIMQEFEIQFDKARGANRKIEVAFQPDMKWWDPEAIRTKLRAGFGKPIEIPVEPVANGGKGGGDGSNMLAAFGGGGGKGGGFKNLIPSFGSGINPAGWVAIFGLITAAMGPIVGTISAALMALPGLLSMLLVPIGAITLGLDGFKKAAEKIKPEFEALRQVMNKASESTFTPVLQRIADEIFPKLKKELPAVTSGLGQMAQGVLDGLAGPRFESIIQRIGDAFAALRPGMGSFTSGLTGLVDQFTLKLPGITQWINEAGAGFDRWVNKVSADGSLQAAFGNLGTIIKEIASTIANLGNKGIEFLSKPENVEATLSVIRSLNTALERMMEVSEAIAKAWNFLFGNNGANPGASLGKPDELASIAEALKSGDPTALDNYFNQSKPAAEKAGTDTGKIYVDAFQNQLAPGLTQGNLQAARRGTGPEALGGAASVVSSAAEAPKVQAPNTEEAKAKLQEYDQFVTDVTSKVKESLVSATQGETLPPPNLDAFKAAWNELPGVVQRGAQGAVDAAVGLISGVNAALQGGTQAILTTVTAWPQIIISALSGLYEVGLSAGTQLANGMVAGINSGIGWVTAAAANMAAAAKTAAESALGIKSPSRVFMAIGNHTAEGMGIGMEKGFGPVLAQAKDIAWKISEAFADGGDPTSVLGGFQGKEVSRLEKVLSFEAKRLELQAKALTYQSKITGNEALKAKAEELRMQKDQITLQKEMLDLTQDYAELNGTGATKLADSPFASAIEDSMKMPFDFAQATGKQFLSDIGIGGNGALSAIADYGTSMASNFIFNVSNIDEAMAVRQNQVSKQGLGINGR